jgi:two-component system cell cycle sensor histidine kinase/response regulator CckA
MKYTLSKTDRLNAFRIVAIYALFASLWIYLSDHAADLLILDRAFLVRISVLKGFLFIVLTSALLYQLIVRYMHKSRQAEVELRLSRSLVNALLEGTTDAIYAKDREGRYLLFNAAATIITGKSAAEVIGNDDTALFPAEDARMLMQGDRKVMDSGKVMTYEEHLIVADGTYRTFLATKGPIFSQSGEVTGLFGIARDITERKKAEEALRRSEEENRVLFDALPDMIFRIDRDGIIKDYHSSDTSKLYAPPESFLGKHLRDVLPAHVADAAMEKVSDVLETGESSLLEYALEMRGELNYYDDRIVRLSNKEVLHVVRDITERKRAEEALRANEIRLRLFIENAPVSLAMFDRAMRYLVVSRRWMSDYGLGERNIRGLSHYDVFPEISERWKESHRRGLAGEVIRDDSDRFEKADGSVQWLRWEVRPWQDAAGAIAGIVIFSENITERKRAEEEREATVELLRICNTAESLKELMKDLSFYFQRITGCEAIGIRLREGDDFPYYETKGFPKEFVLLENSLCAIDQKGELIRDSAGDPALECMCGNIVCGRFDPSKAFFTKRGSFWSSCTSDLLANTTEADRQQKTRNRCNGEGYESVALIPIRLHSETFGLFQFNDKREGRFTTEKIALLEDLVSYVAIALAKLKSDEALRESNQFNQQIINSAEEGVIVYGRDMRYQVWNPYMERLSGLEAGKVLGKHPLEVFPFLKEAGVIEQVEKVLTGETVPPNDFHYHSPITGRSGWTTYTNAPLRNVKGEIIGVIGTVRDITESKRVEEEFRALSHKIQLILNSAGEGIYGLDMEGNVTFINAAGARMLGWDKDDPIGKSSHAMWHHSLNDKTPYPEEACEMLESLRKGVTKLIDHDTFWKKDGTAFSVEYTFVPIYDDTVLSGAVVTFRDITERLNAEQEKIKLEKQFRQAQKMEAIGHLAGGIAHDFNNILTAIVGYGNLLAMKISPADPMHNFVDQIIASSEKAAGLTHSLLAFSRKQVINLASVDINGVASGMKNILERIIGEDIDFKVKTTDHDLIVKCDKGQIEQVLMNLAANARDAMPHGGRLTISTGEAEIDERFVESHQYGIVGKFAVLAVSDSGVGMDQTTQQRIFEPFFTTKEVGKGTGLGLAMVYGTIEQHSGFVNLYSEPGVGTTFKIYLPLAEHSLERDKEKTPAGIVKGTEKILLVEDDANVRKITKILLEELGYAVLEAVDGKHAIELFQKNSERVDLVVCDLIMPKLSGNDVYYELQKIKPDVRVLFVSGYTADILKQKGMENEEINFISKPLRFDALSVKLREILDKPKTQ